MLTLYPVQVLVPIVAVAANVGMKLLVHTAAFTLPQLSFASRVTLSECKSKAACRSPGGITVYFQVSIIIAGKNSARCI